MLNVFDRIQIDYQTRSECKIGSDSFMYSLFMYFIHAQYSTVAPKISSAAINRRVHVP